MSERRHHDSSKASSSQSIALDIDVADSSHIVTETPGDLKSDYIKGWRLHVISTALCLSIFLSGLEVSITATSLVAITDNLHGFRKGSWIVTAYLVTYTGFMIIWAKLSDIFGRKPSITASLIIFVVFSAACGSARTMTELVVLRAFQGIGAGGISSMVTVIFSDLVAPEQFANYTSMVSGVISISLLLGPLFGGLINDNTTWRWIFYLNVPGGIVAGMILVTVIPPHFPDHGLPQSKHTQLTWLQVFSKTQARKIDFPGTALLLAATISLISVLEEAGVAYSWNSAFVIILLIISGISWVGFLFWSRYVTQVADSREPIFPWRFMQSRIRVGLLLGILLAGGPFTAAVIQIPLRYQAINGLSSLGAGVRLLPFAFATALGSVVTAGCIGRLNIPPIWVLIVASPVQVAGFALLSISSPHTSTLAAQCGFEVLTGFAIGSSMACLFVMAPFAVEARDKSVAMSAMIQFRTMGGAIGLAIATAAMNSYVKSKLTKFMSPEDVTALLQSTQVFKALPLVIAEQAKNVFAEGYDISFRVMIGFSAAQLPVVLLLWQKDQIAV